MRISGKLTALFDNEESDSGGKETWKLLVTWDLLPAIKDRVPTITPTTHWGNLADGGTFFVRGLEATEGGLICNVDLFPAEEIEGLPFDWLRENLFGGQPGKTFLEGTTYRFTIRGRSVSFALDELVTIT